MMSPWLCCILALLHLFICSTWGAIRVLPQTDEDSFEADLAQLTRDVVSVYFRYTCVATVTDGGDPVSAGVAAGATWVRVDGALDERLLTFALDADCLGAVVRRRDAAGAAAALLAATRNATRRAGRRLLVLPAGRRLPVDTEALFALEDIKLAPDILVARLVDERGRFELVTVRFTGRLTWRDEIVVGGWQRGLGVVPPSADLFPDKLSDLQGREFVFATFHYPPYVVLEDDPIFQDGLEARMILEFLKKVNATCRLTLETENKWGQIWDNGSGNGVMGAVVNDVADAGYASLGYWYYEHVWLDYSRSYYRTGITCLAPRPRPLPGWRVPLLPFSPLLWAAVGASVLVATAALYTAKTSSARLLDGGKDDTLAGGRYSTVEDCFFRSLGLVVLQAPDVERRHTRVVGPTRHVLSWLLITYLLVTSSYGGGLSSVLTVPRYEPPINTVRDLRDSGLNWAATHIAWLNPLRGTDEPVILDLCERFRALREQDMRARASTRDLALGIERLPAGYFAVGDYIEEEAASKWLRPMREDIYWEMNNVMVRKGWPHLQLLDDLIDRLIDSGLLLAWEGQVTRRWLAPRVQLAVQTAFRLPAAGAEPVKLRLSHVQGEFALLALGLCLSLLLFLGELAAHRLVGGAAAPGGLQPGDAKQSRPRIGVRRRVDRNRTIPN